MSKVMVGLVGCGFVAELHMYAYKRVYGIDAEVIAVAARGDPHRTLFTARFLSHQDIEFFSAHSASRSYSSAIRSIVALGSISIISSARARISAARIRHMRAFCHDASEVMRWTPA